MSVILLSILSMLSAFMQYVRNDYQPLDSQYAVFVACAPMPTCAWWQPTWEKTRWP